MLSHQEIARLQQGIEEIEKAWEEMEILKAKNAAYKRIALYLLAAIELDENLPYQAARARAELEELAGK